MNFFSLSNITSKLVCISMLCAAVETARAETKPAAAPVAPPSTGLPRLELEQVATGYDKPVQLVTVPDTTGSIYVVEQTGKVVLLEADIPDRSTLLDITDEAIYGEESGLLGFAFHPQFSSNRRIYAHYIGKARELENRVSEFVASSGATPASEERKLLRLADPGAANFGGHILFGPDDFLYVGLGDGGGYNDPQERGQNQNDQYADLLRINVEEETSTQQQYTAPVDNPFVANGLGHRDVWAVGLRNPRTFTFDSLSRTLWLGDAGTGIEQEINIIKTGGNYGWSAFDGSGCLRMKFECMNQKYLAPVTSYQKKDGSGVAVGYVYHGPSLPPEMEGLLFYGDRASGKVWGLKYEGGELKSNTLLMETGKEISCFGQDAKGELLLADYKTGTIFRIVGAAPSKTPAKTPIIQETPKS